jgi:alpha-L-rhamnosidase
MFGSVCAWLFQYLAGIKPDPRVAGFRRFIVYPVCPRGLSFVKAHHFSPYGRIESAWRRNNKRFDLDITVPVGSTAIIYFPHSDVKAIRESGRPAVSLPELNFQGVRHGRSIFKATSGTYKLDAKITS